jgi:hypothetical protein
LAFASHTPRVSVIVITPAASANQRAMQRGPGHGLLGAEVESRRRQPLDDLPEVMVNHSLTNSLNGEDLHHRTRQQPAL